MMSFMRAINPENHYGANIAHWKLYTLDYTGEGTVLFITIFSLVIIY